MTQIFNRFVEIVKMLWDVVSGFEFEMYGYHVSWATVVVAILVVGMFLSVVVKN